MKPINYYKTYEDDFIKSKNQNFKLPDNYVWTKNDICYKIASKILYVLAYIFGLLYCKLFLHVKIKNKKILKKYRKQGYFLYGNHTQEVGDVFIPALVCSPKRIYTIASPANLGIPIIGKLLPFIGILPISEKPLHTKELLKAVKEKIANNNTIVIYPEAHVWPYYTKIRPYPNTSFKFLQDLDVPAFCITTTYQKRRFFNKPKITTYVDGPFLLDKSTTKKEATQKLCNEIYTCMINRSINSNYEYIKYKKE